LPLDECLRMEYRIVYHLVLNVNSDFYSGVDAALISKTGSPVWKPSSIHDVTNEQVNALFCPLPPHKESQAVSLFLCIFVRDKSKTRGDFLHTG
jgi:3-hydroxyisobutyryl-CoA hydrolase